MDFKGVDMEGAQFWDNPEDYLDYLELAAQKPSSRAARIVDETLRQFWAKAFEPLPLAQISVAARRLVAAECSAFLEGIDTQSERCLPYVRWANVMVQPGDAVITFNYDRVIEQVAGRGGPTFFVVTNEDDVAMVRDDGQRVPVYKLHGSVDWRWNKNKGEIENTHKEHFALTCEDEELAIASPGPLKQTVTRQLEPLWKAAMEDLRRATQVVFVGYGFPQTDAYAKTKLIESIRENEPQVLDVHIVLGPDLRAPPVVRLDGMLRHALSDRVAMYSPRGRLLIDFDEMLHVRGTRQQARRNEDVKFHRIVAHPLFAEDFLTVVNRDVLTDPPVAATN